MNQRLYVWDKPARLCYAIDSRGLRFGNESAFVPLAFVESGTKEGTQDDLERQLLRQPWYRPEYGFPPLSADPIPF